MVQLDDLDRVEVGRGDGGEPLATLDPVTVSEILNDLSEVTAR